MTLSARRAELKEVDSDTADDIGDIVNVVSILSDGSFSSDAYYPDFIAQGCIQRACERRGWHWHAAFGSVTGRYTGTANQSTEVAGSAAEALLAAYIAAVREEAKR